MDPNPKHPNPPDPQKPGSTPMPSRPGHPSPEDTAPLSSGRSGSDDAYRSLDGMDDLPEEEIVVSPRDPYSETGEFLDDPPAADAGQPPEESSDSWITLKVKAALAVHRDVSAFSTEVVTDHGVVILSGMADTPHQRAEATLVAEGIKGVKRVHNQLRVDPQP